MRWSVPVCPRPMSGLLKGEKEIYVGANGEHISMGLQDTRRPPTLGTCRFVLVVTIISIVINGQISPV